MQNYGIKRKLIWRSGLCPWERCLFFPSMHIQSLKPWSTKKSLLKAIFPVILLHNKLLSPPHSPHSWTVCPQLGCVPIWCQQFLSPKSWYWDLFFNLSSLKYASSYKLFQSQTLPSFRHIAVSVVSALSLRLFPAFSVPPFLLLIMWQMFLLNHIQAAPKYLFVSSVSPMKAERTRRCRRIFQTSKTPTECSAQTHCSPLNTQSSALLGSGFLMSF